MGFTQKRRSLFQSDGSSGLILAISVVVLWSGCDKQTPDRKPQRQAIAPRIISDSVKHDADDPAIWIHPTDPSQSLIIGTDKDEDGALFVYGLDGRIIAEKTVSGLKRPNNVDVEYGLLLNGVSTDVAVTTERYANKIRVFSIPDMIAIDNGGIDVFEGEIQRDPMGIALYKRPRDGAVFAIVSRKEGPTDGTYLWQYLLADDGTGTVIGTKVREFGAWSGVKEIEAVAVDDELGYAYYSDELIGIRKYYADPDAPEGNVELALFGTEDFVDDREGICVYKRNDGTGYILVSDQGANKLRIFTREGEPGDPHHHRSIKAIPLSTTSSDGSEVTNAPLDENFPAGLFVAMSDDRTFHFYSWEDIAGKDLVIGPNGTSERE